MNEDGPSGDLFGKGIPLTREGLFQLLTDEVYKDGVVEQWEQEALVKVALFLKLPKGDAQAIAERSKTKYERGELGATRPLDPIALYKKVIYFIMSDLEIDALELQMIEGLRKVLEISDHSHRAVLDDLGISVDALKPATKVPVGDESFEDEPLFKDVLRPPSMKSKKPSMEEGEEVAAEPVADVKKEKKSPVNVNVTWTIAIFEFCVIAGVTGAVAAAVNGSRFNTILAIGLGLGVFRVFYFLLKYPSVISLATKEITISWRLGSQVVIEKDRVTKVVKGKERFELYAGDELLCRLTAKGIGEMGWTYIEEHVSQLGERD